MSAPIPVLTREQMLAPEKLAELAAKHDGCMHVVRTTDHELHIQLYPLDDDEPPIARAFPKASFEFVFRPPTGREVMVYKKRAKTAMSETAGDELFKTCMIHPTPDVAAVVLERFTLLLSSKAMLAGLMKIGGGLFEAEGKG